MTIKDKKAENKSEPDDLLTQKEAAELSGRSIAAINELIRRERLIAYEKYGRKLVSRADVLAYVPDKGGRPPKPKEPAEKAAKKKGSRK